MPAVDGSTIILLNGSVALLMLLALRATRRALTEDAAAINSWSAAYGCYAASSFLYFMRGHLSPFFTVTLAGTLLTLGTILLCRGFFRFQDRDVPLWVVAGGTVAFLVTNGYFTHVHPSYVIRVALLSLGGVVCYGAILRSYATQRGRRWRVGEPLVLFAISTAFVAYLLRLWDAVYSPVYDHASRETVGEGTSFAAYLLLLNVAQILLANGLLVLTQERVAQKLRHAVDHDALTGALSRSAILDMLGKARSSASRSGNRWAVIMIDIDHFKAINDRYGHTIGDEVLRRVVSTVREQLRGDSHLGRYGGEEFLVVARIGAPDEGRLLAERLRAAVAGSVITTETGPVPCTLSAGVVELTCAGSAQGGDPLDQADQALYEAKRSGRDRVVTASPAAAEKTAAGSATA